MKKSIIALAVAAASLASVAQADGTTLYGSMRIAYTYEDVAKLGDLTDLDGVSSIGNNPYSTSRIGIKGSNDMGNGLSALYKFEWGVDVEAGSKEVVDQNGNVVKIKDSYFTKRDTYIGLAGDFGTVLAGTVTHPYDDVAGASDNFNGLPAGFLRNYEDAYFSPGRTNNTLAYITPDMGGFQATAGVVMDGVNNKKHADAYQITAGYNANGINAAIGYAALDSAAANGDQDSVALALGYSNDVFGVDATVERYNDDGDRNPIAWTLYGEYNINEANKVYASYGQYDYDNDNDNVQGAGIGYQHNFNNRTRVWAEYGYEDTGVEGQDNANTVSLGLRTDF